MWRPSRSSGSLSAIWPVSEQTLSRFVIQFDIAVVDDSRLFVGFSEYLCKKGHTCPTGVN